MSTTQIISPIDHSIVAELNLSDSEQCRQCVDRAVLAQRSWQSQSIAFRAEICRAAVAQLVANKETLAREITLQMGRPIQYAGGEILGMQERAECMINLAEQALAATTISESDCLTRRIEKQALGVVAVLAPWNYPYLTAINAIVPALMAGNSVILKHSSQTGLCAERLKNAFDTVCAEANISADIFQFLHLDHNTSAELIANSNINAVVFTGSVNGGKKIEKTLSGQFKSLALELGGKDAAYVRADCNLPASVEDLVDGAFFNSGQSCCGIERIYVEQAIADEFIRQFIQQVRQYRLGNPLEQETTLGPVVNAAAAAHVKAQISAAVATGATTCIDPEDFHDNQLSDNYLTPQVLVDVDHSMAIMTEETFGPVVAIQVVTDDLDAIEKINDSRYGLTASIWSRDKDASVAIGRQLDVGTVLMNRCDYLDPSLAWVGVKDSGRGCALSSMGYDQFTRPKSYYLNHPQ